MHADIEAICINANSINGRPLVKGGAGPECGDVIVEFPEIGYAIVRGVRLQKDQK